MNDFRLTEHFTFFELTRTDRAGLQELNRRKGLSCMPELKLLAVAVLEPIRAYYGKPVIVHSGFRCPKLNTLIGGSANSQHMLGQAADFHVSGVPLEDVFAWLWHESSIPFGQLIDERRGGDRWIHASTGGKREVLGFRDGVYARLA